MNSIIIFCAKYLFLFVAWVFVWGWLKASRKFKLQMALAVVLAGVIVGILDKLAGKLYYDPRPFVTHHVTPLVSHAADNGFPSEHTLLTFMLATVLYFYRPRLSCLAFGLALLVGIGRVAAGVHSPIDIIGGVVLGLIAGWAGYRLASIYFKRSKAAKPGRDGQSADAKSPRQ